MARRSLDLLLAFVLMLVLSCKYDPHPASGGQICANPPAKACPSGYVCRAGLCRTPDDYSDLPPGEQDASEPAVDASQASDGLGDSGSDTATATGTKTGTACGGLNRACCANDECTAAGTVCNGLTCVACGTASRPCCANSSCSAAGTICSVANTCVLCGASGYICCANDTCLGIGNVCYAGNCVPCGTLGRPCCPTNSCGATLACTGGVCLQPSPDGGSTTSTGTTTGAGRDGGITTSTNTGTIGRPPRDAGISTSTGTATGTKTSADAGIDATTSTGIVTYTGIITTTGIGRTIPLTVVTTYSATATGVNSTH